LDLVEKKIHEFIANVLLEGEEIEFDQETPLLEYRLIDSLNVEELMIFVQDTFGFSLDDWSQSDWGTIRQMADLIRSHAAGGSAAAASSPGS
jgi:geranyl diphosphate 2-C-methyltransferase